MARAFLVGSDEEFSRRLILGGAGSLLGGIGSMLGGGKFGNGAVTGAFGYLFNSLAEAWAGTAATYALGNRLNERDGGGWTVNSGFFGILTGRADLINETTGDTYEIKTNACLSSPSCLARARKQLNDYLEDGLGHGLRAGSRFTVFEGMPNIELSHTVMGVQTSFIYSPFGAHDSGLIGYDRNVSFDWGNQVMKAWNQRRSAPVTPATSPYWAYPW